MTDRVKHLHAVPPPTPRPDPEVVQICKMLLAEAEAGRVRAVALAVDMVDDTTAHSLQYAHGTRPRSLLGEYMLLEDEIKALCRKPSDVR